MKLSPALILLKAQRFLAPVFAHHLVIAFVFTFGLLIYAVYSVNSALSQPTDQQYIDQKQSENIKTRFDETTISQIESLKKSQESTTLELPSGRINPFIP